jgi:hypothetical protein
LNGKWGLINKNGIEITPPKYDKLWGFHNGFTKYKINDKYSFINENGIELTKPLFEWNDIYNIHHHSNNIFWGNKNIIFKNYSIHQNKIKIVL